eukprot:scaffold234125_cov50-Prasinocladus_malaysianus.AAC.2
MNAAVTAGEKADTTNGKVESVLGCEKAFKLTSEQFRSMRGGSEHSRSHLLVSCMLLGDPTPYRIHWPLHSQLRINRIPYRVYGRNPSTKLGANGRDDSFSVGRHCGEGRNTVILQGVDSRPFLLILSLVRKRTLSEVMQLMAPKETIEEAHARICKAVGNFTDDANGNESDDEIETLSTVISLKCPLTGMRVKSLASQNSLRYEQSYVLKRSEVDSVDPPYQPFIGLMSIPYPHRPARFVDVSGLRVFDLDAFLGMVQRTAKWQCPHSMKNSCIQRLQVDAFIERVLFLLEGTDCSEVEVSPEGLWRPAGSSDPFRDVRKEAADFQPADPPAVRKQPNFLFNTD